jgi:hypothetical protein
MPTFFFTGNEGVTNGLVLLRESIGNFRLTILVRLVMPKLMYRQPTKPNKKNIWVNLVSLIFNAISSRFLMKGVVVPKNDVFMSKKQLQGGHKFYLTYDLVLGQKKMPK